MYYRLSEGIRLGLGLGLSAFARMVDFRGRSTRGEVVWFFVILMLLVLLGTIISLAVGVDEQFLHPFHARRSTAVALLAVEHIPLLPVFALSARRLHDIGLPGWPAPINAAVALALGGWHMLSFRTIGVEPLSTGWEALHVATVLLFYAALFWVPRRGPNRYGPDPRGIAT